MFLRKARDHASYEMERMVVGRIKVYQRTSRDPWKLYPEVFPELMRFGPPFLHYLPHIGNALSIQIESKTFNQCNSLVWRWNEKIIFVDWMMGPGRSIAEAPSWKRRREAHLPYSINAKPSIPDQGSEFAFFFPSIVCRLSIPISKLDCYLGSRKLGLCFYILC